ncbi:MAG TPA: hypothetical protein VMX58_13205 [Patescibacteria group bacterium]|nr:hypothetical protein [Patescibacteria group bacterium]
MAGTELSSLNVLEEKINKAAEMIAALRREKNEVEQTNKELKGKIESLYISNEELISQLEALKTQQEKQTDFETKREEIKNKIEEMLVKLEGLDL